jgi:hypothetical protein
MVSSSQFFSELVSNTRHISKEEFAQTFGNIENDVLAMFSSEKAKAAIRLARERMEQAGTLPSGEPLLRRLEFGQVRTAPELVRGEVAAIDGTPLLPLQLYALGQALCVGVGSLSYTHYLEENLSYWSSNAYLTHSVDTNDLLGRIEEGIFNISQTAFLRLCEVEHGLSIPEPILLFDGTLVYEWLLMTHEGRSLYEKLFQSGKRAIGIMKSLKGNMLFALFARALQSGEVFIIETLGDHLEHSAASAKNYGEGRVSFVPKAFDQQYARHILRGIFKPSKKVFAFEVHEDHLEEMIRILAADCQLNNIGHEIPYLLNAVDAAVRRTFTQDLLRERIALQMATQSEELFFEEADERLFR